MSSSKPNATTQPAITKRLIEDHQRIRTLLSSLKSSLAIIAKRQNAEEIQKAQTTIRELSALKNTHTTCEEEGLFAIMAKHHPLPIMEVEHEELLLRRAELVSGILGYSFPEDCNNQFYQRGLEYINMLLRHIEKEEHAIFPLAESALSPEEKQQVYARMEDIRARACVLPTPALSHAARQYHSFQFPIDEPVSGNIHSKSLLEIPNTEVKVLELKAGASLATHWSTKQVLLMLIRGEANWHGEGHDLLLKQGDGITMDPLLPHSLEAVQDCRFLMVLHETPASG